MCVENIRKHLWYLWLLQFLSAPNSFISHSLGGSTFQVPTRCVPWASRLTARSKGVFPYLSMSFSLFGVTCSALTPGSWHDPTLSFSFYSCPSGGCCYLVQENRRNPSIIAHDYELGMMNIETWREMLLRKTLLCVFAAKGNKPPLTWKTVRIRVGFVWTGRSGSWPCLFGSLLATAPALAQDSFCTGKAKIPS